jgi:L,D-transpeptidase ErfK/SrfK
LAFHRVAFLLLAAAISCGAARAASAAQYALAPNTTAIGAIGHDATRGQETLLDVAEHHDLGYTQLVAANPGIDPWLPGAGRRVTIPSFYLLPAAPRRGIVVNLAAQRLYYFPPQGGTVETFPIGIGVQGWVTPDGVTHVVAKERLPTWYPPASIRAQQPDLPRAVPPGPDDPLGRYALRLGWPDYLIHGTNKPDGIGRRVSHGCIHLYPADIKRLFVQVPIGTEVRVIDQRIETGWIGDQLYLAVHPSVKAMTAIDIGQTLKDAPPADLVNRIHAAAGVAADRIDWTKVAAIARAETGIPMPVLAPEAARNAAR